MPFDLSNSLKSTCGWSFSSKGMTSLFISRFYTTAILTVFIIILIMILYPCQKNTPTWILLKLGFYIFIVSLGMIFIHDCVVYHEYEKEKEHNASEKFIGELDGEDNVAFQGSDDKIKVEPNKSKEGGDKMVGFGGVSGGDIEVVGGDAEKLFQMYGV